MKEVFAKVWKSCEYISPFLLWCVFGMPCNDLLLSLYRAWYTSATPGPTFSLQRICPMKCNQCSFCRRRAVTSLELKFWCIFKLGQITPNIKLALTLNRPRHGKIHIFYSHIPNLILSLNTQRHRHYLSYCYTYYILITVRKISHCNEMAL